MGKKSTKGKPKCMMESVYDLSAQNVWTVDAFQVATLWEEERLREGTISREDKLLNTIREAFDMQFYQPQNEKESAQYENGEWATFLRSQKSKGAVAIRQKQIKRIGDLTRENIKIISASMLLELIDRNFGSGWEAIPSNIKEIIEREFDVSATQLPTTRLKAKGGSVERKLKAGYEMLGIAKGAWTEAIFAKRKAEVVIEEPVATQQTEEEEADNYIYDDNAPLRTATKWGEDPQETQDMQEESEDYYSTLIDEGSAEDGEDGEMGDGFSIEGDDE